MRVLIMITFGDATTFKLVTNDDDRCTWIVMCP